MRKFFLSRRGKSLVTTLLIIGTIVSHTKPSSGVEDVSFWTSSHCVTTTIWFLSTIIHIWQHWRSIKALCKKRIMLRNKITTITAISFMLMSISILSPTIGSRNYTMTFHHIVGHLYVFVVSIHTVSQFRRFYALSHNR